jgi:hypothetical protein
MIKKQTLNSNLHPFLNVYKYLINGYLKINCVIASGKGILGIPKTIPMNLNRKFNETSSHFFNITVYNYKIIHETNGAPLVDFNILNSK